MATNFATATYTEIIDMQTTNGQTSIIGIHSPIGLRPYFRLKGFFTNFRKYKYLGVKKCTIVPAAQLPVDPLGITSIAGTTEQMDPRDLLNPIISHGCHGESLSKVLNTIYRPDNIVTTSGVATTTTDLGIGEQTAASDSLIDTNVYNTTDNVANINDAYYNCLTDKTWKKHNIQSGLRLNNLYPLVHNMVSNYPIVPSWTDYYTSAKDVTSSYDGLHLGGSSTNNNVLQYPLDGMSVEGADDNYHSAPIYPTMFTSGVRRLGWMPTYTIKFDSANSSTKSTNKAKIAPVTLPKLFMQVLVLPPSYQVEQYFRCVLVHKFAFKDFTTSLGFGANDITDDHVNEYASSPSYFNWIDYSTTTTATNDAIASGSVSAINEGTTIDGINASTSFVADGVA